MWQAHKTGTDVLRSAGEAGLVHGAGSKSSCLQRGQREKGRDGRERDELVPAGFAPLSCILLLPSVFF